MTDDPTKHDALLEKDWGDEWEKLPPAPPIVPSDQQISERVSDVEVAEFAEWRNRNEGRRLARNLRDAFVKERDAFAQQAVDARAQVASLQAELEAWHKACDDVGIPHDPATLVKHHRANASLATAADCVGNELRLQAELESVKAPLIVDALFSRPCSGHHSGANVDWPVVALYRDETWGWMALCDQHLPPNVEPERTIYRSALTALETTDD